MSENLPIGVVVVVVGVCRKLVGGCLTGEKPSCCGDCLEGDCGLGLTGTKTGMKFVSGTCFFEPGLVFVTGVGE